MNVDFRVSREVVLDMSGPGQDTREYDILQAFDSLVTAFQHQDIKMRMLEERNKDSEARLLSCQEDVQFLRQKLMEANSSIITKIAELSNVICNAKETLEQTRKAIIDKAKYLQVVNEVRTSIATSSLIHYDG